MSAIVSPRTEMEKKKEERNGGEGDFLHSETLAAVMTNRTHKACGPVQLGGLLLAERAAFLPPGATAVIFMHTRWM